MMTFLTSKLGKLLSALVLAMGILIGVFQSGRKTQKGAQRMSDLEDYIETKKEIANVEVSPTRDDAVERLHDNGWVR